MCGGCDEYDVVASHGVRGTYDREGTVVQNHL